MVCKPNGGIFDDSIIEAFEEISFAKDVGVIGNHYGCFAKGGNRWATGSSPSSNSSDGKDISNILMPIVLCMYMFNHS